MKKHLKSIIAVAIVLCFAVLAIASGNKDNDKKNNGGAKLSFGSTFEFDDLEITIGNADDIGWDEVNNSYNDHYGEDVVRLPVTITNKKDETHGLNFLYVDVYGPDGNKLDSVGSSTYDNDYTDSWQMRPGATKETNMHFLYNGDGEYVIEFDPIFGTKIEVYLSIAK